MKTQPVEAGSKPAFTTVIGTGFEPVPTYNFVNNQWETYNFYKNQWKTRISRNNQWETSSLKIIEGLS